MKALAGLFRRRTAAELLGAKPSTLVHLALLSVGDFEVVAEAWVEVDQPLHDFLERIVHVTGLMETEWWYSPHLWAAGQTGAPQALIDRAVVAFVTFHPAWVVEAQPDRDSINIHVVVPEWILEGVTPKAAEDACINADVEAWVETEDAWEDLEATDPFGGTEAHPCSLKMGAQPLVLGEWGCAVTGVQAETAAVLEVYADMIAQTLGERSTCLLVRERDERTGEQSVSVAARMQLPGCPHARLAVLEHLAQTYLSFPDFDLAKGTLSLHWRLQDAVAVVPLGEDLWPHVHVIHPHTGDAGAERAVIMH